jgi:histidinol-phosphate aminotransferase
LGAAAALPRLGAAFQAAPLVPSGVLRLGSNESPYGPFPSVVRAMTEAVARGNYYVSSEAGALRQKIAELHGLTPASVALGVGSSEPLRVSTEVFCSHGHPPVVAEPTFETVASQAGIAHIEAVKIPLTPQGVHDCEKMIDAARKSSAGVFYLCNPANPSATIITRDQLAWIMKNLPRDTVLVSDEAYIDFVDDARFQSALPYVQEGRNVVILKTFSKIYGLAGMRLGYALGPPALIERMRPHMLGTMMGTNQAVVAGAAAALDDKTAYDRVKTDNARVRRFLIDGFRQMGHNSFESQTNFILVDLKRPIEPVNRQLWEAGFAVGRRFPSVPHHLRISLGTMADMQRLLAEVRKILAA